jgi:steroid 5-alpha reductase family enzyme
LLIKVSGAPILDERLAQRPGARRWLEQTPAFIPRRLGRLLARLTPSAQ